MLKVVHYLNQFFGGIGGEDKADVEPRLIENAVGPGRAFQNVLKDHGTVVATVICGDNYIAENTEKVSAEVIDLIEPLEPDLVIAGPAFNAGRFGIACGAVCRAATQRLGIPSVTGMHEENPGVDLYRRDTYIVRTDDSVKGMTSAVSGIAQLALKLVQNEKIGQANKEGYFARGLLVNEISKQTGAERVISMLLDKLNGHPFDTEVSMPSYDRVTPASGVKDIHQAVIALITDGGLVPKGNPDNIEIKAATRYGKYSIKGMASLSADDFEVSHAGYDSVYVRQDPNRLVPVDIMREMERSGAIGKLHEEFYSTAGVANVVDTVAKMGKMMAEDLKASSVSGVILTST